MTSAATPGYALRRTEVYGTDSLLRFALTLWLGDALRLMARLRGRIAARRSGAWG